MYYVENNQEDITHISTASLHTRVGMYVLLHTYLSVWGGLREITTVFDSLKLRNAFCQPQSVDVVRTKMTVFKCSCATTTTTMR